ncbi:MAG: hypothetical protein EA414_00885 [Arthrospira sp. PLM2.Bin9]|nr:FG-GAP-like repeat-containing protein [Arthrospira sp. PLM2.Bin9]TVU55592.1 MAG: hypothetical protein EA414_00885 [Arthrospira sp. PLM2.Bin9]
MNFSAPITNPFGLTNLGTFSRPTFVDINGNGNRDAFVGVAFPGLNGGNIYFYQNIGTPGNPEFAAPQLNPFGLTLPAPVPNGNFSSPTFVDINGDSRFDAFVGAWDGNIYYYPNTGTPAVPNFSTGPVANPFGLQNVGNLSTPTFVDINGDGKLDAFVGSQNGDIHYFENTGNAASPAFAAPVINPFGLNGLPLSSNPTFVDANNNGFQDLFVGEHQGNIYYFENTGNAASPEFAAPVINPFGLTDVGFFSSPTFVDINGDLDAFVGAQDGNIYYFQALVGANQPPTGLDLSNESLREGVLAGTVVGTFTTTDPDPGDTFTYEFVNGLGDADNALFSITDNYLTINISPDFGTQNSYDIRVQTSDQWGASFEQTFTVDIQELEKINGTAGNNILRGNLSDNLIRGLAGNDRIFGVGGNNVLNGGDGNDIIHGGSGDDIIYGGNGDDMIFGSRGNNSLYGGQGDDVIYAGQGDDLIDGGPGNNRLFSNGGSNTFVLREGIGRDLIYNFRNGTDLIQLGGGLTFNDLDISGGTNYTHIKVANTGEFLAILGGTDASGIGEANFTIGF